MVSRKLNKDKLATFIFIVLGVIIISLVGVKVYFDFFHRDIEVPVELKRLELYGYSLESRDNEIYSNYYNELSEVLNSKEIDYDKYANLLAKLYVIDFYTLSNKIASTDIGSLEFVHPDAVDGFKVKAEDTIYKYIKNNFDGKREQVLPEVKDVTIDNIEKETFKYSDTSYESYIMDIKWEYIAESDYQNSGKLTIIKEENKLYVVKGSI